MCVLHTCDTIGCCNPKHLWIGDRAANNADMRRKGRAVFPPGSNMKGETHWASKLTNSDVFNIRKRISDGERHGVIAADYSVDPSLISGIKIGRVWKHI